MTTLKDAQARWDEKYGRLDPEERAALIRRETGEALARLKADGVQPTMTADELMRMTRDRGDPEPDEAPSPSP